MNIDFSNFKPSDLEGSEKYLLKTLARNKIKDDIKPDTLDYMKYAQILSGYIFAKSGDNGLYIYWKKIYKACLKSETNLGYQFYKGHILVQMATSCLVAHRDLKKTVELLELAYKDDQDFGYTNPTYRPAYKILSFLQPLLMFERQLWPSNENTRVQFASRLSMVLSLNKSSSAIAIRPDVLKKNIDVCIVNNPELQKILKENIEEMFEIAEFSEKQTKFYKSIMFLAANIIEGVLYSFVFNLGQDEEDMGKWSITKLSEFLYKSKKINEVLFYQCKFIQNYRDFIHPARNLKHKYRLDINFNKFFVFFLMLLLNDLASIKK